MPNTNLPVVAVLPAGYHEYEGVFGPREARNDFNFYTHCDHCGGWVEGLAQASRENSLTGQLSGRQGTSYTCRRCGRELAFEGILA